jgi:predicted ABC-type transport system involved in lysophospholipase L1 biosynthesis ATPase subunit
VTAHESSGVTAHESSGVTAHESSGVTALPGTSGSGTSAGAPSLAGISGAGGGAALVPYSSEALEGLDSDTKASLKALVGMLECGLQFGL